MRRGASVNSSKAQAVGSHLCMHKAYRLVAGGESPICASGLLALHQNRLFNSTCEHMCTSLTAYTLTCNTMQCNYNNPLKCILLHYVQTLM